MICSARTLSSSGILVLLSSSSGVFGITIPADAMAGSKGAGVGLPSLSINPAKASALTLVVIVTPTSMKRTALLDKAISYSWTPDTSEKLELYKLL